MSLASLLHELHREEVERSIKEPALKELDVLAIRECYAKNPGSMELLAADAGLRTATVRNIIERKTWRGVPPGKWEHAAELARTAEARAAKAQWAENQRRLEDLRWQKYQEQLRLDQKHREARALRVAQAPDPPYDYRPPGRVALLARRTPRDSSPMVDREAVTGWVGECYDGPVPTKRKAACQGWRSTKDYSVGQSL